MAYSTHPSGIGQTCPDIDKIIKAIKNAVRYAEDGEKNDDFMAKDSYFYDIKTELWNIESQLEDLRNANSKLREWGESESDRADKAENNLDEVLNNLPL